MESFWLSPEGCYVGKKNEWVRAYIPIKNDAESEVPKIILSLFLTHKCFQIVHSRSIKFLFRTFFQAAYRESYACIRMSLTLTILRTRQWSFLLRRWCGNCSKGDRNWAYESFDNDLWCQDTSFFFCNDQKQYFIQFHFRGQVRLWSLVPNKWLLCTITKHEEPKYHRYHFLSPIWTDVWKIIAILTFLISTTFTLILNYSTCFCRLSWGGWWLGVLIGVEVHKSFKML